MGANERGRRRASRSAITFPFRRCTDPLHRDHRHFIMTSDLNISLEDHLRDTLASLQGLLPPELSTQLQVYLTQPKPALIPYTVLHSLSQWSRSPSGSSALCSSTPPRDPNDFSMISLLAGTTTSPERKFGTYVPPRDPEEIEAERKRERRAITTLMNAILSVGGSGFAAWWASQHAGWKKEWVRSITTRLLVQFLTHLF